MEGSFADASSHHFFANLLPEGNVREQICKSLKVSPNNDFELLKAIGGDCAGALTITSSGSIEPKELVPRYEPVTEEQLALWSVGTPNAFAAVTGHSEIRLSLAGAQDKLPFPASQHGGAAANRTSVLYHSRAMIDLANGSLVDREQYTTAST